MLATVPVAGGTGGLLRDCRPVNAYGRQAPLPVGSSDTVQRGG
jgi:hypothetical protein